MSTEPENPQKTKGQQIFSILRNLNLKKELWVLEMDTNERNLLQPSIKKFLDEQKDIFGEENLIIALDIFKEDTNIFVDIMVNKSIKNLKVCLDYIYVLLELSRIPNDKICEIELKNDYRPELQSILNFFTNALNNKMIKSQETQEGDE